MALNWRPLGPEPAETYWRRRAVVAGGLLLVVLLLVLSVGALTGGNAGDRLDQAARGADAQPPAPVGTSAGATPDPTAGTGPQPDAPCLPAALELSTAADADEYAAGGRPVLTLEVTNTGAAPCTVDLGQGAVELRVMSGDDRIWSSDDCAPGGGAKTTTLEPGTPVPTRLTWSGQRSLPGCTGSKAPAQPGTYRVTGRVGELEGSGGTFRFTG